LGERGDVSWSNHIHLHIHKYSKSLRVVVSTVEVERGADGEVVDLGADAVEEVGRVRRQEQNRFPAKQEKE